MLGTFSVTGQVVLNKCRLEVRILRCDCYAPPLGLNVILDRFDWDGALLAIGSSLLAAQTEEVLVDGARVSPTAIDGDLECRTDLTHALVAEPS